MPLGVKNGALWESCTADGSWEPTVLGCSTELSFKEDWILLKWSLTAGGESEPVTTAAQVH